MHPSKLLKQTMRADPVASAAIDRQSAAYRRLQAVRLANVAQSVLHSAELEWQVSTTARIAIENEFRKRLGMRTIPPTMGLLPPVATGANPYHQRKGSVMRPYCESDWQTFKAAAEQSMRESNSHIPSITDIAKTLAEKGIANPFRQSDNSAAAQLAEVHFQKVVSKS